MVSISSAYQEMNELGMFQTDIHVELHNPMYTKMIIAWSINFNLLLNILRKIRILARLGLSMVAQQRMSPTHIRSQPKLRIAYSSLVLNGDSSFQIHQVSKHSRNSKINIMLTDWISTLNKLINGFKPAISLSFQFVLGPILHTTNRQNFSCGCVMTKVITLLFLLTSNRQ